MSKAKRAKAFRWEQGECITRLQEAITAVRSGDMYEINRALESVKASVHHLNDNDPRPGRFAPYIQTDGTVHIEGTEPIKGTEPVEV